MATAKRTYETMLSPRVETSVDDELAAPPRLLRCLVVSSVAERRRLIRAAAERQAWDAIVCRDAGEFLRAVFKRSMPLVVVDLPRTDSPAYWSFREAVERFKQSNDGLVVVAGPGSVTDEELWARSQGTWTYVCEAFSHRGFDVVFCEARTALARIERARSMDDPQRAMTASWSPGDP